MTTLPSQIDAILADPLARARGADRPIGFVGSDIAEDILAAPGIVACHLPWNASAATPRADAWLEPAFPVFIRSILQQWVEGAFDFLEAIVFTRGDDATQRLYYYICELQRSGQIAGPKPLIFDIAKVPRPSSEERTRLAVERLAGDLALSRDALQAGIATANARRRWFEGLNVTGPARERIARAGLFAGLEGIARPDAVDTSAPRLLLAGTAPPDDRLNLIVETLGWTVAGETHERALGRLGTQVDEGGNPIESIAAQAHANPVGTRAFTDPGVRIVESAAACAARAVIVWLTSDEEALVWHAPVQRRALEAAGIPALFLTRRRWHCSDGVAEDIAAFLKDIEP